MRKLSKNTSDKLIVRASGRNFDTPKETTEKVTYRLGDATLNGRQKAVATYLEEYWLPSLIGRDPFDTEDTWQYFYRSPYWKRGPVTMSATAAIDMALWALKTKALKVPLYNLLGGIGRAYF